MQKIVVINGHPDNQSFNHALASAYIKGAKKNDVQIEQINIGELTFNPNLKYGYRQRMDLEPDLRDAISKIKNANHIVWFFPMWWFGMPAIMKGFIDRVFLPGITFEPVSGQALPNKLLKGKSARIVITSDSPRWYDRFFMKQPAINQLKKGVLEFCGVNPVKTTYIAPIKKSNNTFRSKWIAKLTLLGEQLK